LVEDELLPPELQVQPVADEVADADAPCRLLPAPKSLPLRVLGGPVQEADAANVLRLREGAGNLAGDAVGGCRQLHVRN
jgi:hypothetical protein